ncbi:MAG: GNAT family N-acetyltransferase [Chloroflexota bacterium]
MIKTPVLPSIRQVLETDRAWSAYALADLDPAEAGYCVWFSAADAVVLLYRGLEPPVLFAHGDPGSLAGLLPSVPAGRCVYTLRPDARARFAARLVSGHETRTWRMVLEPESFTPPLLEEIVRLGPNDLPHIVTLFGRYPDRPDAFHPRQLETGVFFGLRGSDGLLSVAGTHVVSQVEGIAAVGNVFTRPDMRGRGFARATTGAVVKALLASGIQTIVLNVAQDNEPAIRCYRKLGFRQHCFYLEGMGRLRRTATVKRRIA